MNDGDDELDALREERIRELQERQETSQAQEEAQAEARQQAEAQKQAILRQFLTDGARKRLNSVRMSRPDFADQVEQQLIALAQSGRVRDKIDEEQMKQLLSKLSPESRSYNIKRR